MCQVDEFLYSHHFFCLYVTGEIKYRSGYEFLAVMFVFVLDEFDTNTIHLYLFTLWKQFSRFLPTSGKNLVLSQAIIYSPNLFCKECVENIKENWSVYNVKDLKGWSVIRITLWAVLWLQSFHFIDVPERSYVTYYRLFYFSKMNASNFVAQDYTLASLEGDE